MVIHFDDIWFPRDEWFHDIIIQNSHNINIPDPDLVVFKFHCFETNKCWYQSLYFLLFFPTIVITRTYKYTAKTINKNSKRKWFKYRTNNCIQWESKSQLLIDERWILSTNKWMTVDWVKWFFFWQVLTTLCEPNTTRLSLCLYWFVYTCVH